MGFMTGFGGAVGWTGIYGTPNVAEVRRWGADIRGDVLDGTSMDNTDGWRNKKVGLLGGAGTIEVNIDSAITPPMIGGANRVPVVIQLECYDSLEATSVTFDGSAFLTGIHPTNEVAGIGLMTFDFEFTGVVTASNA